MIKTETIAIFKLISWKVKMQCNSFPNPNSSQNGSDIFHIGMEFGGIPSNLLTNFVAWLLILLMFFFARKSMLNIMTDKLGRNWSRIFQLFHGSTRKDRYGNGISSCTSQVLSINNLLKRKKNIRNPFSISVKGRERCWYWSRGRQ